MSSKDKRSNKKRKDVSVISKSEIDNFVTK